MPRTFGRMPRWRSRRSATRRPARVRYRRARERFRGGRRGVWLSHRRVLRDALGAHVPSAESQGAQLADQVAGLAVLEIGGQSLLGRFQAQLLEPLDLGLREIVEPVVGERRSAPQGERLDELAAAHQRLEAVGVERRALDLQRVARGPPRTGSDSPSRARRRDTCFWSA